MAAREVKTVARAGGRPRSQAADQAIIDATLQLLAETGFEGMSVEAVAERAGVGKATIYRRWRSKQELVAAALTAIHAQAAEPNTGDTRDDLAEMARSALRVATASSLGPSTSRVMVAAAHNPELMEIVRDTVIAQRRQMGRRILQRGVERGDVRPDANIDLVVEMLIALVLQRAVLDCVDLVAIPTLIEDALDIIWRGIAPDSATTATT